MGLDVPTEGEERDQRPWRGKHAGFWNRQVVPFAWVRKNLRNGLLFLLPGIQLDILKDPHGHVNYYHDQDIEYYHHPEILTHTHLVIHPQLLAPGDHGSATCHCKLVLLILKMLYKCNHTTRTLSVQLFTQCFWDSLCCWIFPRNFLLFRCIMIYSHSYWGIIGISKVLG